MLKVKTLNQVRLHLHIPKCKSYSKFSKWPHDFSLEVDSGQSLPGYFDAAWWKLYLGL